MATITSTTSGPWNTGGTWVGGIAPTVGDTAVIAVGHTVTFNRNDATETCRALTVNGTLSFDPTMTTSFYLGNAGTTALSSISSTGLITIGTSGTPIPSTYTAFLILDPSATTANSVNITAAGGKIEAYGDYTFNAVAATINGQSTGLYMTTLASDATAGTATATFTDDLGLRAGGGDQIGFAEYNQTAGTSGHLEIKTTASYNAGTKTATFTTNLTNTHKAGGKVGTLTRNVVIKSANAARRAGITAAVTGGSLNPMNFKHVEFQEIANLTGTGNALNAFAGLNLVGCSTNFSTAASVTSIANPYSGTFTNCVFFRGQPNNCSLLNQNGCGFISDTTQHNLVTNSTLTDCWTSGATAFGSSNSNTINNHTFYDSTAPFSNSNLNTINNSTAKYCSAVFTSCVLNTMNNCTVDSTNTNLAAGTCLDIILRGGTISPSSNLNSQQNSVAQGYSRQIRENGTNNGTRTSYIMGTGVRYTSGTVPDTGVFPLPSGASYVDCLTPNSNIANLPVTIRYKIAVTNGTTLTFSVPIQTRGFSVMPTSSQVYLSLTEPGSATATTSTQTISANSTWTTLTATKTATADGYMICDLYITYYQAASYYYIDFPLGLLNANYVWDDGIPSEIQATITGSLAADVASAVAANSKTLTVGKFLALK